MKFYLNLFAGSKSEFFKIPLTVTFAITLLGCEVTLSTPDGSETTSSSPANSVQKSSPSLSYTGVSGKGTINQAITLTPASLNSGNQSVTIMNCKIKPGSANASKFPSTLNINSSTCVISGTPTSALAQTEFTIEVTNSDSISSTAPLTLSVAGAADRLVLVSGNSQTGSIGTPSNPMKVQVVDALGTPYTGGLSLGLMRMLGQDTFAPATAVTTDGYGFASFTSNFGFNPNIWQVVPLGTSLPDVGGTGGTKIQLSSTPTTLGTGTFAAKTDFASAGGPQQVVTGDFNGDGKLDLASSSNTGTVVSVLLGNGNGTFAAKVDYAVGSTPWFLTTADLNRDGKLDLAVPNAGSNTVSILLGNGDGTFAAKVDYATGASPRKIDTGDFNGDGVLDLVISNTSSNTISILLGNGNGTFGAKTDYATGTAPYAGSAVADFNKDGKLDVAVTNTNSASLSVFIGNGNGTFQSKVDYTTGTLPDAIAVADFNSDGNLDLAVANEGSTVSVFMGSGTGTFAAKVDYAAGSGSLGIKAGDFNGDGKLDLVTGNYTGHSISVLLNNGNGTFAAKTDYAAGSNTCNLEIGDFNGDKKLDVVAPNRGSNTLSVFLGN